MSTTRVRNLAKTKFAILLLTLGGCGKANDGCTAHTGDGYCVDPGKDHDGKPLK